jgi:hypothetical protein
LILGLLIKVDEENEIRDDDLILYFDAKNYLLHSGRMKDGRVLSKWGGRAKNPLTGETLLDDNVWLHGWEDIPQAYKGDRPLARFLRV